MFNAKIYSSIYKHNNNKILINNYHSYQIQRKKSYYVMHGLLTNLYIKREVINSYKCHVRLNHPTIFFLLFCLAFNALIFLSYKFSSICINSWLQNPINFSQFSFPLICSSFKFLFMSIDFLFIWLIKFHEFLFEPLFTKNWMLEFWFLFLNMHSYINKRHVHNIFIKNLQQC